MLALASHLKTSAQPQVQLLSPFHAMWDPDCSQDMEYAPKPAVKPQNQFYSDHSLLGLLTDQHCGHRQVLWTYTVIIDQPG